MRISDWSSDVCSSDLLRQESARSPRDPCPRYLVVARSYHPPLFTIVRQHRRLIKDIGTRRDRVIASPPKLTKLTVPRGNVLAPKRRKARQRRAVPCVHREYVAIRVKTERASLQERGCKSV